MRAAIYSEYGPPEVLRIENVKKPVPKSEEVLVKVHATAVTIADSRMRAFNVPAFFTIPARLMFGVFTPHKPILGMDFSGIVEAVGSGVTTFKPGDQVFGSTGFTMGANAEYLAIPATGAIVAKPDSLSHEEAASLPFGACTALFFLRDKITIEPGQKVLVNGASGAVGTAAVQVATQFGAQVTAVCSGANSELVKSLGAKVVSDYTKEDFTNSDERYDIIVACNGYHPITDYLRCINPGGTYLMIGGDDKQLTESILWGWWYSLREGKKVIGGSREGTAYDLVFLKELIASGAYKPVVDRTFPFEQIVDAHRYVDAGHKKGNVVVTIEPE